MDAFFSGQIQQDKENNRKAREKKKQSNTNAPSASRAPQAQQRPAARPLTFARQNGVATQPLPPPPTHSGAQQHQAPTHHLPHTHQAEVHTQPPPAPAHSLADFVQQQPQAPPLRLPPTHEQPEVRHDLGPELDPGQAHDGTFSLLVISFVNLGLGLSPEERLEMEQDPHADNVADDGSVAYYTEQHVGAGGHEPSAWTGNDEDTEYTNVVSVDENIRHLPPSMDNQVCL